MFGPAILIGEVAFKDFGHAGLALGLLGFVMGRPEFLDIAITYALINFVSTIAILKFFRYRSFQVPLVRRGQGGNADG